MNILSKAILFVIVLTAFLFADNWKVFGKPISTENQISISTILEHPDNYVGKKVLVQGRVVDVCKKRGCWMELASDKEYQTIRVKVQDGEIVFPLEGRGHLAQVEGIVEKLEISKEQLIKSRKHHAEENGEVFDPSTVTEGKVIYRLRGLGAKIDFSK